jgi:hypothetical protein
MSLQDEITVLLKDHVLWGCGVLLVVAFTLTWPQNVIVGIVGSGIAVDTWVHRFYHAPPTPQAKDHHD